MVLAPTLGPQADRMRTRGHIIVDRVAALPAVPDIIHAQHVPVALSAMAAFPETPVVFSCHSANFEVEAPRPHPQIRRWIAVDDLCRDRCLSRGIPADRLSVILNGVDLERFGRRSPLPERPRRALLLTKNEGHAEAIRAACARHDIDLRGLGPAFGRVDHEIERELQSHDLVFATARMALEAAAIGCAVVVCDGRGFAGLLTAERLSEWRRLNFGARLLARPTTQQLAAEAIAAYDAGDATLVTDQLRVEASLTDCVAQHVAVYEAAIADPRPRSQEVTAATAAWIEDLIPMSRGRPWEVLAREQFGVEAEPLTARLADSEQRLVQEMARLADQNVRRVSRDLGDRVVAEAGRIEGAVAQGLSETSRQLADISRDFTAQGQALAAQSREAAVDIGVRAAALGGQTADIENRVMDVGARITEIVNRLSDVSNKVSEVGDRMEDTRQRILTPIEKPPQGTFFGTAWRSVVPRVIRAPLFRLRQRLLGRKAR